MKIPTTNRSSTAWGLWFVLLVVPIPVVTAQLQNLINLFFGYGEYGFEIAYVGVPPLDRFWFFRRAALKWSNVITQDVRDVNDARFLQFSTDCGPLPQQVDDVYICASYKIIDGPGGVLGVGFPRLLRNNNLVSHAELNIDQADVQSLKGAGILRNLIMSEIGAVLGINSFVWQRVGLIPSENPPCPYRLASNASLKWQEISLCATAVPTEMSASAGPGRCGHFSQFCMPRELMTTTVASNALLSSMTVGSLQDIGYSVSYQAADRFARSDINPTCLQTCGVRILRGGSISTSSDAESSTSATTLDTSSHVPPRNLSAAGLEAALAYGKKVLQEKAKESEGIQSETESSSDDFIVGEVITVYYQEGGEVYAVSTSLAW